MKRETDIIQYWNKQKYIWRSECYFLTEMFGRLLYTTIYSYILNWLFRQMYQTYLEYLWPIAEDLESNQMLALMVELTLKIFSL